MKALIIDDEINIGKTIKQIVEDNTHLICDYVLTANEAKKIVENYEIIILDVKLPDMNGLDLLHFIKTNYPTKIIIMISGHSGIKEAVTAIKEGAFDFLEKPLSYQRIKVTIDNALKFIELNSERMRFKEELDKQYKIIGESDEIKKIKNLIFRVAKTDSKVLIRGESGTGKELVAYAIHKNSKRADKPFIKFNSAAIPNELVESELFGHEKGAFTGAIKTKKGKLEEADSGTLFLDEIGDMNILAQAKILRVIQDGEFERIGGNKTIKVDIRIIAATHRNLEELIKENLFRHDLFYRLNVVPIIIPPLRERKDDILILSQYFSKQFSHELNLREKIFTNDAISSLLSYKFKGNIRELKNLVERLYIMFDKNEISSVDIFGNSISADEEAESFWKITKNMKSKKHEFEKKYISTQLEKFDCNMTQTANAIEMQISNLSKKIKDLEIDCQKIKK